MPRLTLKAFPLFALVAAGCAVQPLDSSERELLGMQASATHVESEAPSYLPDPCLTATPRALFDITSDRYYLSHTRASYTSNDTLYGDGQCDRFVVEIHGTRALEYLLTHGAFDDYREPIDSTDGERCTRIFQSAKYWGFNPATNAWQVLADTESPLAKRRYCAGHDYYGSYTARTDANNPNSFPYTKVRIAAKSFEVLADGTRVPRVVRVHTMMSNTHLPPDLSAIPKFSRRFWR